MTLFLSAQDIKFLEVGLLEENGRLFSFQKIETTPEKFLFKLSEFLAAEGVSLEEIKKIIVVSGPGSFTSTRLTVTIANAWAFAKNLPILSVPNPERKSGEDLAAEQSKDWLLKNPKDFVVPIYDRPPFITLKIV